MTFSWGGADYIGTAGPRDTMTELTEGGYHADQEFAILVPHAVFGSDAPPAERNVLTVYVDAHGIPCSREESSSSVAARIAAIDRAGGGLVYTLRAESRG